MRDDTVKSVCPECGLVRRHDDVTIPAEFDGPSIRGG